MGLILFIFGLPGSGKSAAARLIKSVARKNNFKPRHFKDYGILYSMFQEDQKANTLVKRFSSTQNLGYDGFDVLDFGVLDEALQKLHRDIIKSKKLDAGSTELLLIEFSRIDYCKALSFFSTLPLNEAYFLFINSDPLTCKARIKARADHPRTRDDRYVSDYTFEQYYGKDQQQYMSEVAIQLNLRFSVPLEHIQDIQNGPKVSSRKFHQAIKSFSKFLLKLEE